MTAGPEDRDDVTVPEDDDLSFLDEARAKVDERLRAGVDPEQVKRHLRLLFDGQPGLINIVAPPAEGATPADWAGRCFGTIDAAGEHAAAMAEAGRNVYVRVSTLREDPGAGRRGTEQDTCALRVLWTDLDVGEVGHKPSDDGLPNPGDTESALKAIEGLPPPTAVVDSGGGLHAYWVFDADPDVDGFNGNTAKAVSIRWHAAAVRAGRALGFHVDAVPDLSRVLRVAGTNNCKAGLRRPCRFLSNGGPTYGWGDLVPALEGLEAVQGIQAGGAEEPDTEPPAAGEERHGCRFSELLEPVRWTYKRKADGSEEWSRPGETETKTASAYWQGKSRLTCFSTEAGLPVRVPLSPGGVFAWLHHDGDLHAARADIRKAAVGTGGSWVARQVSAAGLAALLAELGGDVRWEDPIPLQPPVSPFPLLALPPVLRNWVEALAEAVQVPTDMVALPSLSALSTAVAKKYEITVRPGWVEQANIYTAVIAASGIRKSPLFKAITAPLEEAEAALRVNTRHERKLQAMEHRRAERILDAAEKAASRPNSTDADRRAAGVALQRLLDTPEPAPEPVLLADDTTPEALTQLLAEQGGRVGLVSDEGAIIGNLMGRYSNGVSNIDGILKGYDGGAVRVNRVGRDPIEVRAALTIGWLFQPVVIAGVLLTHPEVKDRGLLARVLPAIPDMVDGEVRIGHRKIGSAPVPDDIREAYHSLIYNYAMQDVPERPAQLTLTTEAAERFHDWQQWLEDNRRPEGVLAGIQVWAAKVDGQTLRLAVLLQLAVNPGGGATFIEAPAMRSAVELMRYFIPHARAVDVLAGGRLGAGDAHALLAWIRRNGRAEFSVRDAQRGLQNRLHTAEETAAAINVLEGHGWVRRVPVVREPGTTGRPASPRFEAHPKALETPPGASGAPVSGPSVVPENEPEPESAVLSHHSHEKETEQDSVDSVDAAEQDSDAGETAGQKALRWVLAWNGWADKSDTQGWVPLRVIQQAAPGRHREHLAGALEMASNIGMLDVEDTVGNGRGRRYRKP